MKHNMKLKNEPFIMMESGIKTIEMRLYDEKRKNIQIGDEIEFSNVTTGKTLRVKVLNLHLFKNFDELYNNFDKEKLGYHKDDLAKPTDMSQFYSDEEIKQYGVVGIEIELI